MHEDSNGSWWAKNWKWFAPTGCLTLAVIVVVALFLVFNLTMTGIKSSDAFREPMAMAQADPEVAAHLGTPLNAGWLISGNVTVSGGEGNASLVIPVTGPEGVGKLYVNAHKETGEWCYDAVVLEIEDKDLRIDLLEKTE